jgi:hypothetical protein
MTVLPLTTKVCALASIEAIAPSTLSWSVGAVLAAALPAVAGVEGVGEETVTELGPHAIVVTMATGTTASSARDIRGRRDMEDLIRRPRQNLGAG